MRAEPNMHSKRKCSIFDSLNLRPLKNPMLRFLAILTPHQFEFSYRHIFSCEASLVNKQLSSYYNRIAGNFSFGDIEIARNQIDIHNIVESTVSEDLNGVLFLRGLFDGVVTSSEEEIVDGCCQPTKKYHQDSEKYQTF